MPISFASIPSNWRIPLYWVEVDPSKAGLATVRQPALLVGIMQSHDITVPAIPTPIIRPKGVAPPNIPIPIGTQAQADKQFGHGSHLANMFRAFFQNNFAHEVWGLPLPEPVGSFASGTIAIAKTGNASGTIRLYIGGQEVTVPVGALDDITVIGESMEKEINDKVDLPVTANNSAGTVTLTCKFTGEAGNDIDIRDNYYGRIGGEELPQGISLTYSGSGMLSTGTGLPEFKDTGPPEARVPGPISNLGERNFEYVAMPFPDATSTVDWTEEYGFGDGGRWGWMRQLYGHIFSAQRGTYQNLVDFHDFTENAAAPNAGTLSVMAVEPESPTPNWEWTAAYTAKAARGLTNDPARPLQTLALNGVKLAPLHERFNRGELNNLAGVGYATQEAGSEGAPMILRETTCYQLNLYSQGDDAYELVTTLATLARLLRNQRHAITSKFPRHKLANDGTRFGPGQAIVTPGIIKAELVANYRIDEFNGLVEDVRNFKRNLIVERDPNNPNRVNVLYPPDLINQLRIFAVLAQFRLQYDRGVDQEIIGVGITGPRVAAGGGA